MILLQFAGNRMRCVITLNRRGPRLTHVTRCLCFVVGQSTQCMDIVHSVEKLYTVC